MAFSLITQGFVVISCNPEREIRRDETLLTHSGALNYFHSFPCRSKSVECGLKLSKADKFDSQWQMQLLFLKVQLKVFIDGMCRFGKGAN
jgi:hypothetical protein